MSLKLIYKDRQFWPLFWTQFVGALNDNFLKNSIVVLIAFKGVVLFGMSAQSLVAFASGVFILPFFLFSAFAGQLADRYEKSQLIRMIKLLEIGIMILASVGFYYHSFGLLLGVLFLMGLHSAFFGPVKYSILPDLLPESQLVSGNAYVELGTFLAILGGTIAGGLAAALENGEWFIILGIIALSLLGFVLSYFIPQVGISDRNLKLTLNPITPTIEIFRVAQKQKAVFNSILGISWFWFFGAAILSLIPVYTKDVLGANETVVTLFLALFTVGIAFGSIICEKLSFERVEIGLVPIGSIGMTFFLLDLYWQAPTAAPSGSLLTLSQFVSSSGFFRTVGSFVGLALFGGLFIVPLYTLIQQRSQKEYRSRIVAGNNILNAAFMVLSSIAIMLLDRWHFSVPQMFLIFACLNLAVSFYIYSIVPEFTLRFISWILVNVMYRLNVKGIDNIPKEGPAVLISNHVSYVDWLILAGACKRPIRFVMYYKLAQIPLLKYLFKHAKVIPIAGMKEDPKTLDNAFRKVSEELAAGELVCIFPEGTLTRDGELNVFKPGIERIIENNSVPVIPMAINGLWGSLFSFHGGKAVKKLPRRFWHRVDLKIEAPIAPSNVKADILQNKVQEMLRSTDVA